MTNDERTEVNRRKRYWRELIGVAKENTPRYPACWFWPVTDKARRERSLGEFHHGRCGVCGFRDGDLVMDHDHDTGWWRGLLCRSCNGREWGYPSKRLRRWQRYPSAARLGIWSRYGNVFGGKDHGRLHDIENLPPHPVTLSGAVLLGNPSARGGKQQILATDPAHLVSAATYTPLDDEEHPDGDRQQAVI